MKIFITLIIVLMLCFILNVKLSYILIATDVLLCILAVGFTIGFLYCVIRLMLSKRKEATFLRTDESKYIQRKTAYYLVEETEYPCIFPAEDILNNSLYQKEKTYHVMLDIRKKRVYDRYAVLTCMLGLLFSIGLDVGLLLFHI